MQGKMYKVLLITGGGESGRRILSQTKGGEGVSNCGKYRFYVNEEIDDPDFVIIRGKSAKRELHFNVAPENVILTTSEPYSVLKECKEKVLGEYNMFNIIARCPDTLEHERPRRQVVLEPPHSMHSLHNTFNYIIGHNYYK